MVAMGGSPGSPEFPSSLVWMQPADRPWCARLTAVIRPLGKWRAAGTPRSATSRASVVSWDDRGTTHSSSPNSRGGGARHRCTRIAWLCSRAAGQQQRVVSVVQLGQGVLHTALHLHGLQQVPLPPIRTGQFHLYCSPPPGLLVAPVPTGARLGQVSSARNLRAARKEGKKSRATAAAATAPARGGPRGLAGCQDCMSVGSMRCMRCGSRALKLSLGPHAAVPILVLGRSEYWVATQTTESRR